MRLNNWDIKQVLAKVGRDEKGCLQSTEKKAAVDVDRLRRPVEKCSLHLFVCFRHTGLVASFG